MGELETHQLLIVSMLLIPFAVLFALQVKMEGLKESLICWLGGVILTVIVMGVLLCL